MNLIALHLKWIFDKIRSERNYFKINFNSFKNSKLFKKLQKLSKKSPNRLRNISSKFLKKKLNLKTELFEN